MGAILVAIFANLVGYLSWNGGDFGCNIDELGGVFELATKMSDIWVQYWWIG
jgi:hypothetical protein